MKELTRLWKGRDYHSIYKNLNEIEYNYTIDNLNTDFPKISSENKFCYLIYLLARDYSAKNVLLVCDFLMYTDTFFYDIHPVIRMIIHHAMELYPKQHNILEWIVSTYKNHPDSPFEEAELISYEQQLANDVEN